MSSNKAVFVFCYLLSFLAVVRCNGAADFPYPSPVAAYHVQAKTADILSQDERLPKAEYLQPYPVLQSFSSETQEDSTASYSAWTIVSWILMFIGVVSVIQNAVKFINYGSDKFKNLYKWSRNKLKQLRNYKQSRNRNDSSLTGDSLANVEPDLEKGLPADDDEMKDVS